MTSPPKGGDSPTRDTEKQEPRSGLEPDAADGVSDLLTGLAASLDDASEITLEDIEFTSEEEEVDGPPTSRRRPSVKDLPKPPRGGVATAASDDPTLRAIPALPDVPPGFVKRTLMGMPSIPVSKPRAPMPPVAQPSFPTDGDVTREYSIDAKAIEAAALALSDGQVSSETRELDMDPSLIEACRAAFQGDDEAEESPHHEPSEATVTASHLSGPGASADDPDRTNRFFKESSPSGEISVHEPSVDVSMPMASPVPIASSGSRVPPPPKVPRVSQPQQGVGMGLLLGVSITTMLIGSLIGGVVVFLLVTNQARDGVVEEVRDGERPAEARVDPVEVPAPVAPPVIADDPAPVAPPVTAQPEPTPVGELTALPDELIVPVGFRAGEPEPESVDGPAIERIASLMTSERSIRVELVGHCDPSDGFTTDEPCALGHRRAEAVQELIRAHGPSRRRFGIRAAPGDERIALTGGSAPDGLLRMVLLRVTER
jgi:outer membrane protein OmpA-like peptidoglycan-associated protein